MGIVFVKHFQPGVRQKELGWGWRHYRESIRAS